MAARPHRTMQKSLDGALAATHDDRNLPQWDSLITNFSTSNCWRSGGQTAMTSQGCGSSLPSARMRSD